MINLKGTTRIVFLFSKYVIKIPNFNYSHSHFLQGCKANWDERKYTKIFKGCKDCNFYEKISPTIYSSWFGLFSIQYKVKPLKRNLTNNEKEYFKQQTTDNKKENFGYLNDKLVCIDYA